eukprot:CAMPEP_0178381412 /NCGR_PEP_ID=MMETSP0689_2-20121128/5969_1 /TAXON_ID=160604 /ORGANISM="Amphidinium massartii, Strain CS-259" /LENGTH=343 /DNA_ID=CAMNT_0020001593 /DNA_START=37 /DNA_END=1064 /DNA_ORIENTATION=+
MAACGLQSPGLDQLDRFGEQAHGDIAREIVKEASAMTMQSAVLVARHSTASFLSRRMTPMENTFLNFMPDAAGETRCQNASDEFNSPQEEEEMPWLGVDVPLRKAAKRSSSCPPALGSVSCAMRVLESAAQRERGTHSMGSLEEIIDSGGSSIHVTADTPVQARNACKLQLATDCAEPVKQANEPLTQGSAECEKTTLMLQNLPRAMSQKKLLQFLDKHGLKDLYDFCYAPCCFQTGSSLGYAFVNFLSAEVTREVMRTWSGSKLPWMRGHQKHLEVAYARQQGLTELLSNYGVSRMQRVRNPGFLPFVRGGEQPWEEHSSTGQQRVPLKPGLVSQSVPRKPG